MTCVQANVAWDDRDHRRVPDKRGVFPHKAVQVCACMCMFVCMCVCVCACARVCDSLVNAYGRVVNWQIKGKKNLAQRLWLGECFKNNFKFAARNLKIVKISHITPDFWFLLKKKKEML